MKYIEFRKLVTSPIFTPQILKNLGATYTPSQLTNWQKRGYLTKLRGGLYTFSDMLQNITPQMIAPYLVSPSYISLSFALSHYGIIPEAVFSITSVTTHGTRSYHLKQGHFTYQHIPPRLFFGYESQSNTTLPYNLADPEKALLDFFYLSPSVTTRRDLLGLRLDLDMIDWGKLNSYARIINKVRVNHLVKLLQKPSFQTHTDT